MVDETPITPQPVVVYDTKQRIINGLKRFGKGIAASLLIAVLQFAVEFLQNNPDLFPTKYTIFVGVAVSALLGIEKALQQGK
jgi:hypothetical protein